MDNKRVVKDLFKAYYQARRHKRGSESAIAFEINYEANLLKLGKELINNSYKISPSTCFISFKPLPREIFAADFRDRIVHHLVYSYIYPIFERLFIDDSYSCRLGKGTSCGIKRADHFIRSCSKNYKQDCYVLKLDIKGYFMSIDKNILYKKVVEKISDFKGEKYFDQDWLLRLIRQIIFHDPTKDCIFNSKRKNWDCLPKTKSLFWSGIDKGLPIGNLTSQLFGNVYLDDFDHFVRYRLSCKYYGRYVDDMIIVHHDKEYLKSLISIIRQYLKDELSLELHPNKIYFQPSSRGVSFLGVIIKPYRLYIRNKTKGNFYQKIQFWNNLLQTNEKKFIKEYQEKFISSMNSYLGLFKRFNTYNLRKKLLLSCLSPSFNKYMRFAPDYGKINLVNPIKK